MLRRQTRSAATTCTSEEDCRGAKLLPKGGVLRTSVPGNGAWVPGVVTAATIKLMADAKIDEALGVFGAADIHLGSFGIEGTLEKYFIYTVVAVRVMAGLRVSVVLPLFDAISGVGYVFDLRRCKLFDGNNPDVTNSDDALKEPYRFACEVDESVGLMMTIQKIESYS